MIFMGPIYRPEQEQELIALSRATISNAASTFQWSIINGLSEVTGSDLSIINALPVGTWPKFFSKLVLKSCDWYYNGNLCKEVGCINLPFVKQFCRFINAKKYIKSFPDEKEIIISTAYMPFLKAVYSRADDVKVTAIITDIPEFYDMRRVSRIRKTLRKINNRFVYKYLAKIDRFVLLTEQMKEPLNVGTRPYVVVEGIYDANAENFSDDFVERSKAILYTGRLNYRYGIGNLLKAFSEIEDDDVQLWICGAGEMENDIKKAAIDDKRIKYLGYQTHTQVLSLQRKAAILVNPRTNEGEYTKYSFPSKTMEYMASGAAVVMYKLDGIPDEYDKYLFYAEKNNSDSLKEKLEEVLYMDKAEREKKGSEARNFILSQKSAKIQAKKIMKMFN